MRHGRFIFFGPGGFFRWCCCSAKIFLSQASSYGSSSRFFLSEVQSLGLPDAYASYRTFFLFASRRHRPVRTPRSCLSRWLPFVAFLSDDHARLLRVSRYSWYQIVVYLGGFCFVDIFFIKILINRNVRVKVLPAEL